MFVDLLNFPNVTEPSGTEKEADFEILTCSEIWSKILVRCVTCSIFNANEDESRPSETERKHGERHSLRAHRDCTNS